MQTATRPMASLWAAIRTQIRETRDERTERARLERELSTYTSPADLDDLYAILDRYSNQETAEIRRILAAQNSGR